MGQGLFVKVAQIVANEFDISLDRVRITATTTQKVPNTSPTASSAGSDLNGMAAREAARVLKGRLTEFAVAHYKVPADQVVFSNDCVRVGNQTLTFDELVNAAYLGRVSLSATGFFKTPHVHFDDKTFTGRPFFYFAYGAAVSEVIVDTLTGEYRVERVDILHDVGRSLNPAIDIGQIEGGFIQGMGWLTTEELWWDEQGRLRTHAPSTYKIPAIGDRPTVMNVALMDNPGFRAETPYWSKAVGEPPLILAVSVHQALLEAVTAARNGKRAYLDAPATPERVLMAIDQQGSPS
jgi:xanthine dehydrogenase large subunit